MNTANLGLTSHLSSIPPDVAARIPPCALRPCPARHPQHKTDEQTLCSPTSLAVPEVSVVVRFTVMEGDYGLPSYQLWSQAFAALLSLPLLSTPHF